MKMTSKDLADNLICRPNFGQMRIFTILAIIQSPSAFISVTFPFPFLERESERAKKVPGHGVNLVIS